jgi:cytochrome c oxidase subunit III
MADAHGKNHDYHLVDPSPWPFVGSMSAFMMAIGAISSLHTFSKLAWTASPPQPQPPSFYVAMFAFILGFALVLYTMFMWWRDVVKEGQAGFHTPVVGLHLRYGMLMFIASEVMFFVAWFWAFFDASLYYGDAIQASRALATGGVWPPAPLSDNVAHPMMVFDPWHLPLVNTLILLTSGTTVTWAHHALLHNDREGLKWGLIATVALGALFTLVQGYEYAHAPFGFNRDIEGNIYGSTFFMATGFHGFHVLIGTIFLAVCLFRALQGQFTPKQHFGFEAAAWYWHFVDVVWLFLFACIYIWGNHGGLIHGAE